MKHVLVITTESHTTFDIMIVGLLLKIKETKIILLVPEEKAKHFTHFNERVIIKTAKKNRKKCMWYKITFLRNYFKLIKKILHNTKIDLAIATTCENVYINSSLLWQLSNTPFIMVIHNIDKFYLKKPKKTKEERLLFPKYSFYLRIINNRLLRKANLVFTLTNYLAEKLEKIFPDKKIETIPFRLSTKKDLELRTKLIKNIPTATFTISGYVNSLRKNYDEVFSAFAKLNNFSYKVVLLGSIKDKSVIKTGKKLLGDKLIYFNYFIDETEYTYWLNRTHFLLGNLNISAPYGVFKASIVEFDGPALGIPVLLPNDILSNAEHGFYIRYSRNELTPLLKKLINSVNNGIYKEYLENALREAQYFNEISWAKKMYNIFNELIDV